MKLEDETHVFVAQGGAGGVVEIVGGATLDGEGAGVGQVELSTGTITLLVKLFFILPH